MRALALAITVMCQVACARPVLTSDSSNCVPHTYHACTCEDGRTGIRMCSGAATASGPCDCDSAGGSAKLPLGATTSTGAQAAGKGAPASAGQSASMTSGAAAGRSAGATMGTTSIRPDAGSGSVGTTVPGTPAASSFSVIDTPTDEASYIFDDSQLRTYNIIIAPADLAKITAMPSAEQLVPAKLEFEGETYGPFSVRFKGSQGSFVYPCTMDSPASPKAGKCSMKLDFNETNPDARFFGLKKINFHSMNADESMLRDRLGYQLFREMGVASPRAVHARVMINGELEGLFIAVEQIDSRFTRAHFSDGGKGNVYKEVWPMHDDLAPYMNALETNKDDMKSVAGLLQFKQALDVSSTAAEAFYDRDYTLNYLAVDRVIINDDGAMHFWCNEKTGQGSNPGEFGNHNYYWYEETTSPRYWLIPWDLDHSFDNNPAVHLDVEWSKTAPCVCKNQSVAGMDRPASCDGLVKELIAELPAFDQKVEAFVAGPLRKQHVDSLIKTWSDQIRSVVTEAAGVNLAPDTATWNDGVNTLIKKVDSARTNRGWKY